MVFAANSGNPSLNSCLETGVSLLEDLCKMLRIFRTYAIGITGDIEKAFNCLKLKEEDQLFLKFLWYTNGDENGDLQSLMQTRVNFGTNDAPFKMNGTLQIHLTNHGEPQAKKMKKEFYSDNWQSGALKHQQAQQIIAKAIKIMADGGFPLRKFKTNNPIVNEWLKSISKHEDVDEISVLGMNWNTIQDTFAFKQPKASMEKSPPTKRSVLATTASYYDPLGFLAPLVMPAVSFVSGLWDKNYGWDDPLNEEDIMAWAEIAKNLKIGATKKIPRFHDFDPKKTVKLHVMTDASNIACGANAFLQQGDKSVLVGAKFKLPAKRFRETLTTPKRELIAMLLGANLAHVLQQTYKSAYPHLEVHLWTDSEIALCWLHTNKNIKEVFVANRVRDIKKVKESAVWYHIDSANNSADLTSRGMSGEDFLTSKLYWYGPEVFKKSEYPKAYTYKEEQHLSLILATLSVEESTPAPSVLDFFDLTQVFEMTEIRRRLATIVQAVRLFRKQPKMTMVDLQKHISRLLFKAEQAVVLEKELAFLHSKTGSRPSLIRPLKLFLDKHGIIRCGGRLGSTLLPYHSKFPVLITKDSPLLKLRVLHTHKVLLHAGQEQTKSKLREAIWVPQFTSTVKKILKTCYECKKATGPAFRGPSAPDLKDFRVQLNPYRAIGVDLTGHFWVKTASGETVKAYVCIFTCTNTRHINLELLLDYNTDQFILALRKHCATYGKAKSILADNASYFHAAEEELKKRLKGEVQFLFQPSSAPWYGSIFERMIKETKTLMKRTLGRKLIPAVEMEVFIKEVAAVVNDRPLTVSSDDLRDDLPLTPNKLIFGRNITPLSHEEVDDDIDPSWVPGNKEIAEHWRGQAQRFHKFRHQFNTEYLAILRQRHAYDHNLDPQEEADIQVGDIVLMYDQGKRNLWKRAEVLELLPSSDDAVRAVRLRTINGETTRPLSRLYPLLKVANRHLPITDSPSNQTGSRPVTPPGSPNPQIPAGPTRPRRAAAIQAQARINDMLQYI